MRFDFDREKSRAVKRRHGVSLKEAQEIFDQVYLVDQKNDDPEQFRAIGWCRGRLCSVIFQIRHDPAGEYYHLITAWKATKEEERSYAENV
ncbi:MAG: BrnT family toxin [Acidobacteriia bacterium]|nr:BrnT family toxin [Terriglobia bacterium]